MANVRKTDDEKWGDLRRWSYLFRTAAHLFDAGSSEAAIMLSVQLRQLLHDQNGPLKNLGIDRTGIKFFTTPLTESPGGLVKIVGYGTWGAEGSSAAMEHQPIFDFCGEFGQVDYLTWWTGVLKPILGTPFSRRHVVMEMADRDGGAHVDKILDEAYSRIKRQEDIKFEISIGELKASPEHGRQYAIVRQIAFEVQLTLDEYLGDDELAALIFPAHPRFYPPEIAGIPGGNLQIVPDHKYLQEVLWGMVAAGEGETLIAKHIHSQLYWPLKGIPNVEM